GKSQSPERYRGKVLLIDMGATWSPSWRQEIPRLTELYGKYHDRGFAILGVSLDVDKRRLQQFAREGGIAWPEILPDRPRIEGGIVRIGTLRIRTSDVPRQLLIDREGIIRAINPDTAALEKSVAALLDVPPPAE